MFLSLLLAVSCAALLEGTLDYFENRDELRESVALNLTLFADEVAVLLDLSGEGPRLDTDAEAHLSRWDGGHFRVLQVGEVRYRYNPPFGATPEASARTERDLEQGYRLEAVLDIQPYRERFRREMRADLSSDNPLFLAIGLGVALLLSYFVLQPVRSLSNALHTFSLQREPKPLPVPPGNDELSRLVQTYNTMSATIELLLERERTFTRYASHELRTPLSVVKVQLEAFELGLAPLDEVLPKLSRSVERMDATINALLSLVLATDAGHPESLQQLLQELVESLPEKERARVTLDIKVATTVEVPGGNLVRQAVDNLLTNALKYSQGPVTLSAALNAARGSTVTTISDEGLGVSEVLLDEITKPFFRIEGRIAGSGLGLALVNHIAHTLGGELALHNKEKGLEAKLVVPVVIAD
jgi:signal transduction histidine kinase